MFVIRGQLIPIDQINFAFLAAEDEQMRVGSRLIGQQDRPPASNIQVVRLQSRLIVGSEKISESKSTAGGEL
jgi:hypothetical protein